MACAEPTFADRGKPLQSRSIQLCVRRVSDVDDPIKSLLREDILPVLDQALIAAERQWCVAHTELGPKGGCDCSIQVTSFSAALSLSSLDQLRGSRLLLPRSGLERSDSVLWHQPDMARCRLESAFRGRAEVEFRGRQVR